MGAKVILLFVLVWLSLAFTQKKNCSDCVGYRTCDAAVVAIQKTDPDRAVDEQRRSVFCGFDSLGVPMVCCSELTAAEQSPLEDSVENHPNLRLLPETCGYAEERKHQILGGEELYEFPWVVLIAYKTRNGPQFMCGGSLINEYYVLTAAHCISSQELLGVRVGEYNIETATDCQGVPPTQKCESNVQDLRIEEAIPHPEYHGLPTIRNDVGLLRLKRPVNLTFVNAGTICLPVSSDVRNRDVGGLSASVAGWGVTEKGYASSELLSVEVPIHAAEYCRELYNRDTKSAEEDETTNKICAGLNGQDSCRGDSGGPLMIRTRSTVPPYGLTYVQYGIAAYGLRLCGSQSPGVYTDVTKYMKWILDSMKP